MTVDCEEKLWLLLPQSANRLELFRAQDGTICFTKQVGDHESRVFVISLPKAGTYLVATILGAFGFANAEMHIGVDRITDYREMDLGEKFAKSRTRAVDLPFETSTSLILPGQFAVGHVPFHPSRERRLTSFSKVLVIRRWRDCMASFMHFEGKRIALDAGRLTAEQRGWAAIETPQERFAGYLQARGRGQAVLAAGIAGWLTRPGVLVVRFEELMGDYGSARQYAAFESLRKHLGVTLARPIAEVCTSCIGAASLTYSGQRSNAAELWSEEANALFSQLDGPSIERSFGYLD